ncbi:MAG: stage V sporulation protein AB [Eubacteriales bacterium]|nr:stage V sporulation protein AB [Eubacteriales bacterium]
MNIIYMALAGAGGGFLVAAGVVALLVGLGIITRFTGISHTAAHSRLYESAVLFGALFGNMLTVFETPVGFGRVGLMLLGISSGMYVGGWIMALAEVIHIFPVFARRIGLTKGFSIIVIAIALGKAAGSMLHFYMRW